MKGIINCFQSSFIPFFPFFPFFSSFSFCFCSLSLSFSCLCLPFCFFLFSLLFFLSFLFFPPFFFFVSSVPLFILFSLLLFFFFFSSFFFLLFPSKSLALCACVCVIHSSHPLRDIPVIMIYRSTKIYALAVTNQYPSYSPKREFSCRRSLCTKPSPLLLSAPPFTFLCFCIRVLGGICWFA